MARTATGSIKPRHLGDGSIVYDLRARVPGQGQKRVATLHERAGCACCGGGWDDRSARIELGNIQARIRAGVWRPGERHPRVTAAAAAAAREIPTFHVYASDWLQAKIDGVLGGKPIDANTRADYLWRLRNHLLPFFAKHRLDDITDDVCIAFKAHKLREASDLRIAIAAGADIRDRRGRRIVPLAPASIRKLIDTLASILDEAIEDHHITTNPARGRRMKVTVPKPSRTFLELDELAAITDAAAGQDEPAIPPRVAAPAGPTAARVAAALERGMRNTEIAADIGLSKATISYHVRRLNAQPIGAYEGRAFALKTLGYSGVRVSELCDLLIREVRVHDPAGARFHIPDSKTPTGVRAVEMSPDLAEAFVEHLDRLRRAGHPTGPDDHVLQNRRGGRVTRQRVAKIVSEAATAATAALAARGLPPLPRTTPHSLRRTYISISLLANNFDVKWVMSQVGHADSKMTLDVYAQLEQRAKRDHGRQFDRLVRGARDQLHGHQAEPALTVPTEWEAADA